MSTRPRATCSRTRRSNGSSTPGPVPQVKWKRGTELPWPCARPPPRSAQPTTGNQRMPIACSHGRISPAAKSMKASATLRGQWSSGRSNCAEPIQSCKRKRVAVANAHAPLLRAVDEEQAAERPEGLAAERILAFLFEDDDLLAGVAELGRRDQPAQAAADDDDVCVSHRFLRKDWSGRAQFPTTAIRRSSENSAEVTRGRPARPRLKPRSASSDAW